MTLRRILDAIHRRLPVGLRLRPARQQRTYKHRIQQIRERGVCRVTFIVASLPMWRYEDIYQLLKADERFEVEVAFVPFATYSPEKSIDEFKRLKEHFPALVDATDYVAYKARFQPDMLFYPQPYETQFGSAADWKENRECLLVHTPYSLTISTLKQYYNLDFHNLAWRIYLASDFYQSLFRNMMDTDGSNLRVSGDSVAATLMAEPKSDPWKSMADGKQRKRIIWAPHYSVMADNFFSRPEFNWTYKEMQRLAVDLADRVQIAFKPHPLLLSKLYQHPDWGKERADEFYKFWTEQPNTQLEAGEYFDLFLNSDAIIHNCGSFTVEYLLTGRPAAYVTQRQQEILAEYNELGQTAQRAHYVIENTDQLRDFILRIVNDEPDPLADARLKMRRKYFPAMDQESVSQAIYNDITLSLWPKKGN